MRSEASATTCAATSSGCATLRSAIVRETARTRSGSTRPRVTGDSGGRADEDEGAVPGALHLAQERTGDEEGGRQVRTHGCLPALERELPYGDVVARPDAVRGDTHVDRSELRARLLEEPVDVGFERQIAAAEQGASELVCQRACPVLTRAIVEEEPCTLRRERTSAGRPDPAGRTRDEHPLAFEPGVQRRQPMGPRGERLAYRGHGRGDDARESRFRRHPGR